MVDEEQRAQKKKIPVTVSGLEIYLWQTAAHSSMCGEHLSSVYVCVPELGE